jgi:hypothetical protein
MASVLNYALAHDIFLDSGATRSLFGRKNRHAYISRITRLEEPARVESVNGLMYINYIGDVTLWIADDMNVILSITIVDAFIRDDDVPESLLSVSDLTGAALTCASIAMIFTLCILESSLGT